MQCHYDWVFLMHHDFPWQSPGALQRVGRGSGFELWWCEVSHRLKS